MNQLFTHSRDIYCYLSSRRLVYSIPLFFEPEKAYLKSNFLEIEICQNGEATFLLERGDLKTVLRQPGVSPWTLGSCCEKK